MTRINLIDPSLLADQHLFAEFREIKMIPKALGRSLRSLVHQEQGRFLAKIPPTFTLNAGHVCFFYDKGLYLSNRYAAIRMELFRRGIKYNVESPLDPDNIYRDNPSLNNDWIPSRIDYDLIIGRLAERILMKPEWYRYYGSLNGHHVLEKMYEFQRTPAPLRN